MGKAATHAGRTLFSAAMTILLAVPGSVDAQVSFTSNTGTVILDGNVLQGPYRISVHARGLVLRPGDSHDYLIDPIGKSAPPAHVTPVSSTPHDIRLLAMRASVSLEKQGMRDDEVRARVADTLRHQSHLVASVALFDWGLRVYLRDGKLLQLTVPVAALSTPGIPTTHPSFADGMAEELANALRGGACIAIGTGYMTLFPKGRAPAVLKAPSASKAEKEKQLTAIKDPQLRQDLLTPKPIAARRLQ